ncbi:MAG: hypothetical protein WDZ83_09780 [Rhizobiaceae bacterium]
MSSNNIGGILLLLAAGWFFFGGDSEDTKPSQEQTNNPVSPVRTVSVPEPKKWDDSQICGHAVQTYFVIVMPPRYIDWRGNTHIFRSESGNRYECLISGDRVILMWINDLGQSMRSDSTRVRVDPRGVLHVKTDMMAMEFE